MNPPLPLDVSRQQASKGTRVPMTTTHSVSCSQPNDLFFKKELTIRMLNCQFPYARVHPHISDGIDDVIAARRLYLE